MKEQELETIRREVADWMAIIGLNQKAILQFLKPEIILYGETLEIPYSRLLAQLTEDALQNLQPTIEWKTYQSPNPQGKIRINQTIRNISQGRPIASYKRPKLTIESLPVLLMLNFHHKIATKLQKTIQNHKNKDIHPIRTMKKAIAYHTSITDTYPDLTAKALQTNLENPENIEKAWKQASTNPTYQDIILLWQAYLTQQIPKPHPQPEKGESTPNPISKIYELWCLKQVTQQTQKITGEKPKIKPNHEGGATFKYPKSNITIEYNTQISRRHLTAEVPQNWETPKLRPDIRILKNEKTILTLDAKYRLKIDSDTIKQMITYLTLTTEPVNNQIKGIILYCGKQEDTMEIKIGETTITIKALPLKPKTKQSISTLKQEITQAITNME